MDGRQSLGIALGDEGLNAVLLRTGGRDTSVAATAALPLVPLARPAAVADALNRLCADLNCQSPTSQVLGLPLSVLSVHRVHLPFQDARQQAQAFPCAMEDQLLSPVEQVASVYHVAASGAQGVELLAFAADRALLQALLPEARARDQKWIFDPDSICPAAQALALQAIAAAPDSSSFLVLHADLHSATLIQVQAGGLHSCRQLHLPPADALPDPSDGQEPRQWVVALATAIRQSLALFRQQQEAGREISGGTVPALPTRLYLCGPRARDEALQTGLAEQLNIPVERLRARLAGPGANAAKLSPAFDAALACALQGLHLGRPGLQSLNFRQGVFAKTEGRLWRSKHAKRAAALALTACVALVVFLAGETRSLNLKSRQLRQEMTQVYRSAFPQVQVVHDPYLEMRAALGNGAGADTPLLFSPNRESVLSLLADISSRIPGEIALTVNRFSLDQELVLLRGETASFREVDQIRNLLAASPLFSEVRILSSTAAKNDQAGLIRFELRLQRRLAGGSQ